MARPDLDNPLSGNRFQRYVQRYLQVTERPDIDERLRRSRMEKYLLAGERPVIADHQHWAMVAKPVGLFAAGLVLVVAVDTNLPNSSVGIVKLLWYALLVLFGWTAWRVILWRRNWFVATDKRMLLNHGVINVDVAMLSLTKVVDLTYTRSTMGRLLGYGTFVRESAGQQQTLRQVDWVKRPEQNYNILCAAIFGLDSYERGTESDDLGLGGDQPTPTSDPYAVFARAGDRTDSYGGPIAARPRHGISARRSRPESDWVPEPTPHEHDVDDSDDDSDDGSVDS